MNNEHTIKILKKALEHYEKMFDNAVETVEKAKEVMEESFNIMSEIRFNIKKLDGTIDSSFDEFIDILNNQLEENEEFDEGLEEIDPNEDLEEEWPLGNYTPLDEPLQKPNPKPIKE